MKKRQAALGGFVERGSTSAAAGLSEMAAGPSKPAGPTEMAAKPQPIESFPKFPKASMAMSWTELCCAIRVSVGALCALLDCALGFSLGTSYSGVNTLVSESNLLASQWSWLLSVCGLKSVQYNEQSITIECHTFLFLDSMHRVSQILCALSGVLLCPLTSAASF